MSLILFSKNDYLLVVNFEELTSQVCNKAKTFFSDCQVLQTLITEKIISQYKIY